MIRNTRLPAAAFRIAAAGFAALSLSCASPPLRPSAPAAPFKAIPLESGAKFKPGSAPESRVASRYAPPPGRTGFILDPAVATPVPPTTGVTISALALGCDPLHYLLDRENTADTTGTDNRFSWWGKTPPSSGPLRPPATVSEQQAARDSLVCHFHPALARVVGIPSARTAGYKFLSWANQSITSPNQLPDVEFVVRRLRPHTLPTVRELARAGGGTERVLVNQSDVAPDISGDRFRPSLWFEFAAPQRAVAIEFGAPTDANQAIKQAGVKLIGYDINGGVLRIDTANGGRADLQADGRAYGGSTTLVLGDFGNVIGIQDREGRIARVELRFDYTNANELETGGDPGNKIVARQVVTRIWHEPLPPAAVFQGSVGVSTHTGTVSPPPGVIPALTFEQRFGKLPGPETLTVPFGFDRAIVMIRGMRWQFAFFQPLPVTELSATLSPSGVAELGPNDRQLTITPSGRINGVGRSSDKFHLLIDYTVLAWRRDQVELFATAGSAASGAASGDQAVSQMVVGDPCPFSSTTISVERRRELCGPLFGAPQSIAMRMNPAQEIDRMDLVIASEKGIASGQGVSLRRADQGGQPIVTWEQGMSFEGSDDNPHTLEFSGTVLSGTSLKVGPDALGSPPLSAVRNAAQVTSIPRAETGPRDDRTTYGFSPATYRAFGIAWPVAGDVAFVAFEQLYVEPNGPLEQLDFEVKGDSYQGAVIDWKTGLGINTEPPIIGGLGATRDRFLAATALFGAVDNVAPFSLAFGTKRDIVFETGVAGLTQRAADIPGLIENTSRDALWIDELNRGTQPADRLFQLEFVFPRHPIERDGQLNTVRVTEDQFRDRLPMLLRPGERITILGSYTPQAATFLPDIGSAEFRVRGIGRSLRVFILGSAIEANPLAEWRPLELVFAAVPPAGPPQQQVAMLASIGSTPLVINRLFFEDASLGYSFVMLPQIEPELVGIRVTCGDASAACRSQTRLIADTNAGMIPLTVRVQP